MGLEALPWSAVLYCTVLHCTVLYCISLLHHKPGKIAFPVVVHVLWPLFSHLFQHLFSVKVTKQFYHTTSQNIEILQQFTEQMQKCAPWVELKQNSSTTLNLPFIWTKVPSTWRTVQGGHEGRWHAKQSNKVEREREVRLLGKHTSGGDIDPWFSCEAGVGEPEEPDKNINVSKVCCDHTYANYLHSSSTRCYIK